MTTNKLRLNNDKSEFFFLHSRFRHLLSPPTISVGIENIRPPRQARNLGVIFDDTMSLSPNVYTIVKGAFYHIRNISKIRKYFSKSTTTILCKKVYDIYFHHICFCFLSFLSSVIDWESVPGAKSCGQPIWLKLGTEVGYDEIFQQPLWLTSLTFSFGVTGRVSFFALWAPKIQPSRGHFESVIRPHW